MYGTHRANDYFYRVLEKAHKIKPGCPSFEEDIKTRILHPSQLLKMIVENLPIQDVYDPQDPESQIWKYEDLETPTYTAYLKDPNSINAFIKMISSLQYHNRNGPDTCQMDLYYIY